MQIANSFSASVCSHARSAGHCPTSSRRSRSIRARKAHWVVHGTLCERLALPGTARTEPANQYFPITGDEPFHASGARPPLAPDPAIMPRDLGVLIITSSATVFRGAKRNVRVLHDALRGFALFSDGVRLDTLTSESSSYFLVSDPELTGAIILRAARDRRQRTASRPERVS